MQTAASQNVLIFLFGLVNLLASGVNVDWSTSFSVLMPKWHQEKLFPTHSSSWLVLSPVPSANSINFKAHHCELGVKATMLLRKSKSCRQLYWSAIPGVQKFVKFPSLLSWGKVCWVWRRWHPLIQAAKGVSVSIIETAHKSKNMAVDGLLCLISMKQMSLREVQLRLQAHLT